MADIFDWSSTPGSNTLVDGINIAEGCPAGNVNNGMRSMMALIRNSFANGLKTFLAGGAPLPIANGGTGGTSAASARAALDVPSKAEAGTSGPTGQVAYFAVSSAPAGWLKANGAAVSRTTYAALFAAIGTTFGNGDGSTTFNLPDLRGEFVRGWDDSRGIDAGRSLGTAQTDAFKTHNHQLGNYKMANAETIAAFGAELSTSGGSTVFTSDAGGTETRPRNVALLACIKT